MCTVVGANDLHWLQSKSKNPMSEITQMLGMMSMLSRACTLHSDTTKETGHSGDVTSFT